MQQEIDLVSASSYHLLIVGDGELPSGMTSFLERQGRMKCDSVPDLERGLTELRSRSYNLVVCWVDGAQGLKAAVEAIQAQRPSQPVMALPRDRG